MPTNRRSKSPRKSLHNLLPGSNGGLENVPPLPSQKHHLSPSPANGAEPARIQLSPLSNNELNGTSRQASAPASTPAVGGGFTAVNTGGFRAVNTAPPERESSRDGSRPSSREPQHVSPSQPHRDVSTYTSPYDPAASTAAVVRLAQTPALASSAAPSAVQGFRADDSSLQPRRLSSAALELLSRPVKSRDSPAVSHAQHAHIAPQPKLEPQPSGSAFSSYCSTSAGKSSAVDASSRPISQSS
jgi:hypothetical protein